MKPLTDEQKEAMIRQAAYLSPEGKLHGQIEKQMRDVFDAGYHAEESRLSLAKIEGRPVIPVGYARKQNLLTYDPVCVMYAKEPQPENGHKAVPLYTQDQLDHTLLSTTKEVTELREALRGRVISTLSHPSSNTSNMICFQ